jgi:hypothetical protein
MSCAGLPCIDAKVDGNATPLRLVLNLSSKSSYLNPDALQKLKSTDGTHSQNRNQEASQAPATGEVKEVSAGSLELGKSFFLSQTNRASNGDNIDDDRTNDGALSYTAFKNRVVIVDMPHGRLQIFEAPKLTNVCIGACSSLIEVQQADFAEKTLATRGFEINGRPVVAVIDSLYRGDLLAVEPIEGILEREGTPNGRTYNGDKLFSVNTVRVTFKGDLIVPNAELARYSAGFAVSGRAYNVRIGGSVLLHTIYAFDFQNNTLTLLN